MKLAESPLCQAEGCNQMAVLVHHTKPEREFKASRLELDALMSLCNRHHEQIHAEDRWGGAVKS